MIVTVKNGTLQREEIDEYIKYAREKYSKDPKYKGRSIVKIEIELDGEFANLSYEFDSMPFDRIRRITGYLTPVERFNNAKLKELGDRVKHGTEGGED